MFVVTGGSSGIGCALAKELAHRGRQVLIIGRRGDRLEKVASSFSTISYLQADVSTPEGCYQIRERLESYDYIEGLVHNAGIIEPLSSMDKIKGDAWHQIMATNLTAPFFITQLLFDKLINGRVLHIGSGAAYHPIKGWAGYCVSKAALSMLNRCWQLEFPARAFSSVMPGVVDTPMQVQIRSTENAADDGNYFRQLKEGNKLISPETVSKFLCWLLLDIEKNKFKAKEWDIYEKSHHSYWLKPPHIVPALE